MQCRNSYLQAVEHPIAQLCIVHRHVVCPYLLRSHARLLGCAQLLGLLLSPLQSESNQKTDGNNNQTVHTHHGLALAQLIPSLPILGHQIFTFPALVLKLQLMLK